jgi:hypothetical protein
VRLRDLSKERLHEELDEALRATKSPHPRDTLKVYVKGVGYVTLYAIKKELDTRD